MSKSGLRALLAFIVAALLAVAAVGLITQQALKAEQARADADAAALLEENVRLALWRIDSEIAALLATENSRPYFAYRAYHAPSRPYHDMMGGDLSGDSVAASPLLGYTPQYVQLHFQLEPTGKLTSPQVPSAQLQGLRPKTEGLATSQARLSDLRRRLQPSALKTAVAHRSPAKTVAARVAVPRPRPPPQPSSSSSGGLFSRGSMEWSARVRNLQQVNMYNPVSTANAQPQAVDLPPALEVLEAVMAPVWMKDDLLLVRRLKVKEQAYLQGAWLDWVGMQKDLLDSVTDLLPNASLVPVPAGQEAPRMRLLASLPVRLVPGALPVAALTADVSTLKYSLSAAWAGVLLALFAFGALMVGAVGLSERRATFVSAVTHELRTPLTTFQMYTEMLSEGMVSEDKRARYLQTLRREAIRLCHLVDNVLAYARVEQGSAQARPEVILASELLARIEPRLSERAATADMVLDVHLSDEAQNATLDLDTTAIEQILFNLVDNACKYACDDSRILLTVNASAKNVAFALQDYGLGVPGPERRQLFAPFSKSAQRAAQSAPGVGLGLALSRRLARALGGDLKLERGTSQGACFVLSVPIAKS